VVGGHFVHDALSAAGIRNQAFNEAQMRMIASSRKKTDRRDAWWIANALAAGRADGGRIAAIVKSALAAT